ncbi:MAG: mechanosensitive ion channel family protein [Luteolibacter sp.]
MPKTIFLFIAILTLGILPSRSQETEGEASISAADPKVSREILSLMLDPLTKDELKPEVQAWQTLLKQKAQQVADLEIKALRGTGDLKKIYNESTTRRQEKAALVDRVGIVLDAYESKGGDTSTERQYLAAVKSIKTEIKDVSSRLHTIQAWITSSEGGIKTSIGIVKFVVILIIFWILALFVSRIIRSITGKQDHISELLQVFINKMARRTVLFIGLIVALGTIGVNVGAALALIGGASFILAFALQDTLSNFASGVMLLIYRPFDVGSSVEVGGVSGKVDSVSLVSTTIRTFDNKKILIPNKKVWGETITNITGMPTRRVDMIFGIGYDSDSDKAQEILERLVTDHPLTLEIPEPAIHMHELADSSVNFICRPWAKTSDHWNVYWDITKSVKKEFDAAGISIPFPQRDVHIHNHDKP